MDLFYYVISFAAGFGVGMWFGKMRPHWGWASRIAFGLSVLFLSCAIYAIVFDAAFPVSARPFAGIGIGACILGLGWNNRSREKTS